MSRLDRLRDRWPVPPRVHVYAAWAALVLFTLIVVSGAAVRLTGSGLGCPEWPRCNGTSVTPSNGHAYIEFSNRLITTPVSLAAVLCLVLALLRRPYRRDFTVLGGLLVIGVAVQAVLGGVTVMTGLNPVTVMSHFLLSMATLVVAVTLVWRATRERRAKPQTPEHDALLVRLTRALVVAGGFVVVVGTAVTASGPYAGGEGTNDTVSRLDIFGNDTFRTVIMVHARVAAVFGVCAVALWLLARLRGARDLLAPLTAVCVAVAVTGAIGTLQYHILAYPAWTVWLHVASVCLLWLTLVWSYLAVGRPVRAALPAASEPPSRDTRAPAAV
ncbi:MAG: heme a synthase [Baekduia sp.]|jgi:cytochrome c oxidase assembly protein subunit 15|nr:heme a synthase [Baekduia sp.]